MNDKIVLSFELNEHGFTLENKDYPENYLYDDEETEAEYPEVQLLVDREGQVRFLDFEFIGLNDEEILKNFSQYVSKKSFKGLYTVPELGLKNVPFEEVVKAVRKRILKGTTTAAS